MRTSKTAEDNCANSKNRYMYRGKEYFCTLELAMDIIGGKWKTLIVFHLRFGAQRSSELQHSLNGISNKMFTQSIRALEGDGIVKREIFPVVPPRVEYSLTNRGQTLIPLVEELARWGHSVTDETTPLNLSECDTSLRNTAH